MNGNVIPLAPRPKRTDAPAAPPTTRPAVSTSDTGQQTEAAVYTVAEVAELLSLSPGTAYALVRTGEIPARKLGGKWVIPKRRFHEWIDNLPEATPEEIEREFRKAGVLPEPIDEKARP